MLALIVLHVLEMYGLVMSDTIWHHYHGADNLLESALNVCVDYPVDGDTEFITPSGQRLYSFAKVGQPPTRGPDQAHEGLASDPPPCSAITLQSGPRKPRRTKAGFMSEITSFPRTHYWLFACLGIVYSDLPR